MRKLKRKKNQSMLLFYIVISKLNCFYIVHYCQDTI